MFNNIKLIISGRFSGKREIDFLSLDYKFASLRNRHTLKQFNVVEQMVNLGFLRVAKGRLGGFFGWRPGA